MLNSKLKKWARIDEEHMFDLKFQLLIEFLQDKLQEIPLCFFLKNQNSAKKNKRPSIHIFFLFECCQATEDL
jgi:hypothetical protein